MKRLIILPLALIAAPAIAQTAATPITVDGGQIDGKALAGGVTGWLGVPFAAPPLRDLRWRAPRAVAPWQGIYHADRVAPMCLQALRARTMNQYFGNEATSEDCLYLNVWAPAAAHAKLPVVVWIYGGGFTVGSASMANYSGEGLARQGVVTVNIAYRLGAMGFLAHPDLSREGANDRGGHSGDYGLMDQVAGLEWVKRNIAGFGGDPDNVTVMGQSAGSMSVSLLQINPRAHGLFQRLVGMSGSAFGQTMNPVPLATGEAQGVKVQQALGARGIEAMRDIPGDRILAAAGPILRNPIVIDGANITASAEETFAAHRQNDVPVMVGFVRDEHFAQIGAAKTVADYQGLIRKTFPQTADAVLSAYPAASDADVPRELTDVERDMSVGSQMFNWAKANAAHGSQPAYGFFFTRRHPYTAGITFADHDPATVGVYHTGDVPYWLSSLDALNMFRTTRDWSPMDRQLAVTMSGMVVRFAHGEKPAANWPAFDPRAPKSMQLGEEVKVIGWPNAKALPLLVDAAPPAPAPAATPRVRD